MKVYNQLKSLEQKTAPVLKSVILIFLNLILSVFYVEMTWKQPFPRCFNVKYTRYVCKVGTSYGH